MPNALALINIAGVPSTKVVAAEAARAACPTVSPAVCPTTSTCAWTACPTSVSLPACVAENRPKRTRAAKIMVSASQDVSVAAPFGFGFDPISGRPH